MGKNTNKNINHNNKTTNPRTTKRNQQQQERPQQLQQRQSASTVIEDKGNKGNEAVSTSTLNPPKGNKNNINNNKRDPTKVNDNNTHLDSMEVEARDPAGNLTSRTAGSSHSSSHEPQAFPQQRGPPSAIVIDEGMQLFDGPLPPPPRHHHQLLPPLGGALEEPPVPLTTQDREAVEHMSLLELGEETMAQAMLIFLLADLRILSATGRIRTKFDHLALDSDRSPRLTSQDYAGFYDYEDTDGVTASHIMAILLVEILREAEDAAKERLKKRQAAAAANKSRRGRRRRRHHHHHHHHHHKPALLSPWATESATTAGVNARQVFKRDVRAANGMPSLLHCYNEMLSEDVAPRINRVSRKVYPLDEDLVDPTMDGDTTTAWLEPPMLGGEPQYYNNNTINNNNNNNYSSYYHGNNMDDSRITGISSTPGGAGAGAGAGCGACGEFPDEVSFDGGESASWQWNPNTTVATPASAVGVAAATNTTPAIPKPQGFHNTIAERSGSMSHFTQGSLAGGGPGAGGISIGNATPTASGAANINNNTMPSLSAAVAAARLARRASTNFQVSHFNPNVDIEEMENDDDSVNNGINLMMTPLRPKTTSDITNNNNNNNNNTGTKDTHTNNPKKPASTSDALVTFGGGGFCLSGIQHSPHHQTPSSAIAMVNASIPALPALNSKFKEIRERVEKVIPEQLATLTKNFPKTQAARQQQELEDIAQVQNQLLKWDDKEGSSSNEFEPETPMKKSSSGIGMGGDGSSHHKSSHKRPANRSKNSKDPPSIRIKHLGSRSDDDEEEEDHHQPKQPREDEEAARNYASSVASQEGFEVAAPSTDDDDDDGEDEPTYHPPEYHDSDTIRQLILQALDKRDFWRLGFIKTFFREGTVSHVLANSRAEMVWLSDWHTQYECTYAISIDREKGKVLLAFRGAYTESDWRHIVDWYDTATSNPVKEDYPGRAAIIRLHSGFHKYLFRVRKDTQTTKYDEIAAKLAHYCKMTGPNTRITITGHSLGAALAAIFSLYASTEDRFTDKCGAIECVTFGAPCIGNWRFAGAVKHQENVGKLRIAKFHVKGDSVPHLPPALFRYSSRGAQYWHSGIDVSLPYIRKGKIFKTFLGQPKPKITYWDPDEESYFGSLLRQVREYYVWNLPLRFWRFALFHTLVEHKKRMALVSSSDPNSLLTKCSLKELYEMRDDLTRRPFWKRKKKTGKKS